MIHGLNPFDSTECSCLRNQSTNNVLQQGCRDARDQQRQHEGQSSSTIATAAAEQSQEERQQQQQQQHKSKCVR